MILPVVLLMAALEAAQLPACDGPDVLQSPTSFIECARAATARFQDREAAIREGYRKIGRDFPAMGEHWIRMALLFDGRFDATRPEVLNYIVVDGKPKLLGVGYALPLLAGERPPEGPAGAHAWHDHSRTIEEETVVPHHDTHGSAGNGARIAMMHAWIWSANPEGAFAADNWALPFIRLGLNPPDRPPLAAAKALSLATGGREYLEMVISAAGAIARGDRQRVKEAIDRAREKVMSVLAATEGAALRPDQLTELEASWTAMWIRIERGLAPEVRQKLEVVPIR